MSLDPLFLFECAAGILGAGAILAAALYRNGAVAHAVASAAALLGSLFGGAAALAVLVSGTTYAVSWQTSSPLLAVSVRIDQLSALFLLTVAVLGVAATWYGIGYMRHYAGRYGLGRFGFLYNVFLLSLFLVVTAAQSVWFLLAWEAMSLASYALVVFEHREPENLRAGFLYLVMTHLATAFLAVAFLLLYAHGGLLDFDAMRQAAGSLSPALRNGLFILLLIGFGTKAGMVPLHIWLPKAHPAAPSHVSALMSGVMIKTGILMMVRFFVDIMPGGPVWWGATVLVLGAVSSLVGVLLALAEHDIKRLLAYHSVENIGIILMGLGSSLIFASLGLPALAALALVAALFHVVNHAVFKGLLFLGAGSAVSAAGSRNIEEHGGLLKRLPYTGLFFLIGAMAISALPPLNGFASEWLTYQGLFAGIAGHGIGLSLAFIMAIASLAFTGGLAAACFVKAFGISFLARPRSAGAENALEQPASMLAPMGLLALLCVSLGLAAAPAARGLAHIASSLFGTSPAFATTGATVTTYQGAGSLSQPLILLALAAAALAGYLWTIARSRGTVTETDKTWNCGTPLTPRMQMSATGFSRSIVTVFQGILRPSRQVSEEYNDANSRYFPVSHSVHMETHDIYERYAYVPVYRLMLSAANRLSRTVQNGNLNLYILYLVVTLVALCVWVAS